MCHFIKDSLTIVDIIVHFLFKKIFNSETKSILLEVKQVQRFLYATDHCLSGSIQGCRGSRSFGFRSLRNQEPA
jgi:hypothetical protein